MPGTKYSSIASRRRSRQGFTMRESGADKPTTEQDRTLLKVLPIALLVAAGLTAGGLYFTFFQVELLLRGVSTTGEVVALESGTSSTGGGRPAWFPVVTFETRDGETVRFRHRTGSSPAAFEVGDKVRVTYLPDTPEKALIAEGVLNWLLPLVLLVVGPGLAVISLRGMIGARRRLRAQA